MLTRHQLYAEQIFQQVSGLLESPEKERKKYGSIAHSLPVLIRTAGLAQALAFLQARRGSEGQLLLGHLAVILGEKTSDDLLKRSRTAPLSEYIHLTRQVMAALFWHKRFAQSVLNVEAADDSEEGEKE
ncbi:MAG TPA: type III-B CRISPR module-associated protein Cmr5 [Candidatus Acidoferrales bacterium]|nr:type III-B CRISPR module-associated protein Cmr5 [Candidatus Acidoferrales bacterium]